MSANDQDHAPFIALKALFEQQRAHQWAVARTSASERIGKLRRLHDAIIANKEAIQQAVWDDLRKSKTEADVAEISALTIQIRYAIRHLRSWMATRHVGGPLALMGTRSAIRYEPKGVCLIISPWNFPILLTLNPLVAAIAAGNCAILKPSEHAPASSALLSSLIAKLFPPEEICVVEGDAAVAQWLTAMPFNHISFTGSPAIAKHVMEAAARNLCSVTLELGGKNPVIVDPSADLDYCAGQLAWINAMNAGQSCVEPDYVLVHRSIHDQLVEKTARATERLYGQTPEARRSSPDLCRLIHERHFQRAKNFLDDAVSRGANVAFGGRMDASERYLEPTLLTQVSDDALLWTDELFCSLLPFRPYDTPEEAIQFTRRFPSPLAFYVFSRNRKHTDYFLSESRAGTTGINDLVLQVINPELPFGGVNNSGIGKSNGHHAFLEFSNSRSVIRQNTIFPLVQSFRPPYDKQPAAVKWLLNSLTRWL